MDAGRARLVHRQQGTRNSPGFHSACVTLPQVIQAWVGTAGWEMGPELPEATVHMLPQLDCTKMPGFYCISGHRLRVLRQGAQRSTGLMAAYPRQSPPLMTRHFVGHTYIK